MRFAMRQAWYFQTFKSRFQREAEASGVEPASHLPSPLSANPHTCLRSTRKGPATLRLVFTSQRDASPPPPTARMRESALKAMRSMPTLRLCSVWEPPLPSVHTWSEGPPGTAMNMRPSGLNAIESTPVDSLSLSPLSSVCSLWPVAASHRITSPPRPPDAKYLRAG